MVKKVIIGFERSGRIRESFKDLGWYAVSCDLEDTMIPGLHIKGDVRNHLKDGWDLGIFHPPCTYLTTACAWRWDNTQDQIIDSVAMFFDCMMAPIERICIENPQGYLNKVVPPDQILDYGCFGARLHKRTCLWLKGLPGLIPKYTADLVGLDFTKYSRKSERDITPWEFARELARQWG